MIEKSLGILILNSIDLLYTTNLTILLATGRKSPKKAFSSLKVFEIVMDRIIGEGPSEEDNIERSTARPLDNS